MSSWQKKDKDPDGVTGTQELRAVWTTADDTIVVRVLQEQKDAGNQSGAGWKKKVWTIVAEALQKESVSKGALKTATKCSDHWYNVTKKFLIEKCIAHCSIVQSKIFGGAWDL